MPQRLLSWRALGKLQQPVKARSIRVINITVKHFTQLLVQTDTAPAVNQVEVHPYLYPRELLEFCAAQGIVITANCLRTNGERLHDRKLLAVTKKYKAVTSPPARATKVPYSSCSTTPTCASAMLRMEVKFSRCLLIQADFFHKLK